MNTETKCPRCREVMKLVSEPVIVYTGESRYSTIKKKLYCKGCDKRFVNNSHEERVFKGLRRTKLIISTKR